MIQIIKEDIQLFFLQKVDDDNSNCLHMVCKLASKGVTKSIIEVGKKLSKSYHENPQVKLDSKFYTEWKKIKYAEVPKNRRILVGLMQTISFMNYTPFFHLCERIKQPSESKEKKKQIGKDFTEMIMMLIDEVDQVDPAIEFECFGTKNKHWADMEYVH
jgi:hypothetical protein